MLALLFALVTDACAAAALLLLLHHWRERHGWPGWRLDALIWTFFPIALLAWLAWGWGWRG